MVRGIPAGQRGRGGCGSQRQSGRGRGYGRRMAGKRMVPDSWTRSPVGPAEDSQTKTEITREQELDALKAQERDIQAQILYLEKRIRAIETGTSSDFKAFVDSDKCAGCGTCEDVCPVGAIVVDEIASIDAECCIGCGSCVAQCPRGALNLYSLTEQSA
ncbi:4Fe-4S binding protein [Desulfonema magnum]|uniref:4Fe-4S dicluster domain-containing protein n=1 Tax=Desulfonema magnum TaxID=45655 RepID=A0A975BL30_9BACT|nr:4Fe-4S binding protein [Desulfonema magnum]QTA87481.1 4Fe-4S dicluster domain-containing protein [Desulfonema magnum]